MLSLGFSMPNDTGGTALMSVSHVALTGLLPDNSRATLNGTLHETGSVTLSGKVA